MTGKYRRVAGQSGVGKATLVNEIEHGVHDTTQEIADKQKQRTDTNT